MHPMAPLFIYLLFFLSSASSFQVKPLDPRYTEGDNARIWWKRESREGSRFRLRLRKLPGNTNGPVTFIDTHGQPSGTQLIKVENTGEYMIELYDNQSDLDRGSPQASSEHFFVVPKSGPPPTSTRSTPSPPPPPPPTSSTKTPDPSPESSSKSTGTTNDPNGTATNSDGQSTDTTGTGTASRSSTSSLSAITVVGVNDQVTTIIPKSTPQLVTFLSNSQLVTSTIAPVFPTSPNGDGDTDGNTSTPSGVTKKSNLATIIGAAVGSIVFLLFLIFLLVLYRRKKRRQATNTFFRDKMVRNTGSSAGLSPTSRFANPSMTSLNRDIPLALATTPTANAEIPYKDLDERIEDYDETYVTQAQIMPVKKVNPYSGEYGGVYAAAAQSPPTSPTPSGLTALAAAAHPVVQSPPSPDGMSDSDHGSGLFYVSTNPRANVGQPMVMPSYAPGSIVPGTIVTAGGPISSSALARSPLGLAAPRTDRQMEIHEKIVQLQAKLIGLQSWTHRSSSGSAASLRESQEYLWLKRRIEALEGMMSSSWALGLTDVPPIGYHEQGATYP